MEPGLDSGRSRFAWWTFGAVIGFAVVFVVLQFVGTFVFGVFLYYATRPVYRVVREYVGPPAVAAAGSLFLLALPALLTVGYVLAISISEIRELSREVDLGPLAEAVGSLPDVSDVVASPQQVLTEGAVETALGILGSATGFLGLFGLIVMKLFVMFAVAFYLLKDDHHVAVWVEHNLSDDPGVLDAYLDAVDQDLDNIFFGNILNAVIAGTIGAIAYSILNLFAPPGLSIPYPVLVGLLSGVASLIPIVGMKLVHVPVGGYLFVRPMLSDASGVLWFPVTFVVVSLVLVDFIPDLVVRPYVSGRNLHVGMVMVTYILGPLVFGWYGLFLAPLLLVLAYHFVRIILPELVSGDPITPAVADGSADASPVEESTGSPGAAGEPATESVEVEESSGTTADGSEPETSDAGSPGPADSA